MSMREITRWLNHAMNYADEHPQSVGWICIAIAGLLLALFLLRQGRR